MKSRRYVDYIGTMLGAVFVTWLLGRPPSSALMLVAGLLGVKLLFDLWRVRRWRLRQRGKAA